MSGRRRSSIKLPRDKAREVPQSVELEQRLSRLEVALHDLHSRFLDLAHRMNAIQAHLDHLDARAQRF